MIGRGTFAGALFAVLVVLVLSCGAKRATPPASFNPAYVAGEAFIDTSKYAMQVSFRGCSCDTAKAIQNLRNQIASVFQGKEFRNTIASARIVLFDTNNAIHEVYSLEPDAVVLPASVEKLFTSSST